MQTQHNGKGTETQHFGSKRGCTLDRQTRHREAPQRRGHENNPARDPTQHRKHTHTRAPARVPACMLHAHEAVAPRCTHTVAPTRPGPPWPCALAITTMHMPPGKIVTPNHAGCRASEGCRWAHHSHKPRASTWVRTPKREHGGVGAHDYATGMPLRPLRPSNWFDMSMSRSRSRSSDASAAPRSLKSSNSSSLNVSWMSLPKA